MTSVSAVASTVRRIPGIPPVARVVAPERLAATNLQAMSMDRGAENQREQHCTEPTEPPFVSRTPARHIELLCARGHHV